MIKRAYFFAADGQNRLNPSHTGSHLFSFVSPTCVILIARVAKFATFSGVKATRRCLPNTETCKKYWVFLIKGEEKIVRHEFCFFILSTGASLLWPIATKTDADDKPRQPPFGSTTMIGEYQVQKSGLAGLSWTTICRGDEDKARAIFKRQLDLYSIGRFRLLDAQGHVLEERKAQMTFFAK